ncbi:hypothetical protein ASE15_03380 [Oerskovia sp. Root22]|nr:hypothetical protein ASE15_03380 [Oerskovia sp. Root22]
MVDGFDQVLLGPAARLAPADRRRIIARARERDVALIDPHSTQNTVLTLEVQAWAALSLPDPIACASSARRPVGRPRGDADQERPAMGRDRARARS